MVLSYFKVKFITHTVLVSTKYLVGSNNPNFKNSIMLIEQQIKQAINLKGDVSSVVIASAWLETFTKCWFYMDWKFTVSQMLAFKIMARRNMLIMTMSQNTQRNYSQKNAHRC